MQPVFALLFFLLPFLAYSSLLFPFIAYSQETNQQILEPIRTGNPVFLLDDRVTAFTNVNVIPMDEERTLSEMTVIIKNERIQQIGTVGSLDIPPGSRVIDAGGKFLIPGLAEMHGHIPPVEASGLPARYMDDVLFLYLAGGVTTVRGMLGHPGQLELKDQIQSREIVGPNLYLAGPSFRGSSIHSPEQAADRVREQVEEGWDLLKIHPGLSLEEYTAMAETANELGIPFAGHVPEDVGLENALALGQLTVDHLDGYIAFMDAFDSPVTEQQLQRAVQLTQQNNTWVIPTQALWETLIGAADPDRLLSYDELKYMPPQVVGSWTSYLENNYSNPSPNPGQAAIHAENRQKLLKALQDGGVRILMGTDSPQYFSVPGLTLIRELELMEAAGLTRYEILKSGTVNVGEYFSDKDTFGTISEGSRADLILLPGNPLEDLSVIEDHVGVMVRGQWLTRDMINHRLEEIENAYQ